jgi:hypothetical protein
MTLSHAMKSAVSCSISFFLCSKGSSILLPSVRSRPSVRRPGQKYLSLTAALSIRASRLPLALKVVVPSPLAVYNWHSTSSYHFQYTRPVTVTPHDSHQLEDTPQAQGANHDSEVVQLPRPPLSPVTATLPLFKIPRYRGHHTMCTQSLHSVCKNK